MPINIGNNLEINNNEINASQSDLFKKLNVAYGWTHTKTTSEGGTAVILSNSGGPILNSMECNDINSYFAENRNSYSGSISYYVCNGKLYNKSGEQVGTKSNWKIIANNCGIDSDGLLWRNIGYTNPVQIGEDNHWTKISNSQSSEYYGICDGYLYYINNTTVTKLGTDNQWIDIVSHGSFGLGICNGYLYTFTGSSGNIQLVGENNNWVKIYNGIPANNVYAYIKNDNDDLYAYYGYNLSAYHIQNVKKVMTTSRWSGILVVLLNNNKIYKSSTFQLTTNPTLTELTSSVEIWNDIGGDYITSSGESNALYAIGDNKLYRITSINNTPVFTQLGTEENYQKIDGTYDLSIAWTGDATTISHTVYSTKSPQISDNLYTDIDLTKYSTVQSVTGTTVTDQYRTYDRDVSKDSSFTAIPPATVHETVSTIDFLRITNPNT